MIRKIKFASAFSAFCVIATPSMAEDNGLVGKFTSYLQSLGADVSAKIAERAKKAGVKPYVSSGNTPSQTPVPNFGGIITDVAGAMGRTGSGAYSPSSTYSRGGNPTDPKTGHNVTAPLLN